MDARTALLAALAVLGTYSAWQRWESRPVHQLDGALAPDEPVQTDIERAAPVRHGRWLLTPRASYEITARILGREDYRFDRLADLVPEDLALGWGPMSDNHVLAAFDISQGARFYTWRPRGLLPITREDVIVHSANTHVIPADARIGSELARLRVGQVVRLAGTLVDAVRDDGAWLRTSLARTDSGAGACGQPELGRCAENHSGQRDRRDQGAHRQGLGNREGLRQPEQMASGLRERRVGLRRQRPGRRGEKAHHQGRPDIHRKAARVRCCASFLSLQDRGIPAALHRLCVHDFRAAGACGHDKGDLERQLQAQEPGRQSARGRERCGRYQAPQGRLSRRSRQFEENARALSHARARMICARPGRIWGNALRAASSARRPSFALNYGTACRVVLN